MSTASVVLVAKELAVSASTASVLAASVGQVVAAEKAIANVSATLIVEVEVEVHSVLKSYSTAISIYLGADCKCIDCKCSPSGKGAGCVCVNCRCVACKCGASCACAGACKCADCKCKS